MRCKVSSAQNSTYLIYSFKTKYTRARAVPSTSIHHPVES